MQKPVYILLIIAAITSVVWSIYRDIRIEKQYTGDLRNRIVGARLQKDGIPPYFYKWKSADGLRYYDPQNFDSLKVSNITATPFLHQLLYPIADLPQRKISKAWLAVEYLFLLFMVILALSFAKTSQQKLAVLIATALFLFSIAWTGHIAAGQVYIFIPFFAWVFYYFINKKDKIIFGILTGISAAVLILIRPTTIFFLLPFLFFLSQSKKGYLVALFTSSIFVFIFGLAGSQNNIYWKEYSEALKEQLKSHQSKGPAIQKNEPDPGYESWEGWDKREVAKEYSAFPYDYNQEHGNVFVIINHTFKIKTPVWALAATLALLMFLVVLVFYRQNIPTLNISLYQVSILGFLLYMLSDFFSPIHRFLYYGVQWLFPLLLISAGFDRKYLWIYIGIIAGILLNSTRLSFMPMENTVGEYVLFLFFLVFLFKYKPGTTA